MKYSLGLPIFFCRAMGLLRAGGAYPGFFKLELLGTGTGTQWMERSNLSKATCPGLQTNMPVTRIEPMTLGL